MKNRIVHSWPILVMALLVSLFPHLAEAQEGCRTQFRNQAETAAYAERHKNFLQNRDEAKSSISETKFIPVHWHFADGIAWSPPYSEARAALARANNAFSETNIRFYECGTSVIGANWYSFESESEEGAMINTHNIAGVLNVYVVNEIEDGGCGYANFPGTDPPNSNNGNNFVVMDIDCMDEDGDTTLEHEFGHIFDLAHTHETAWGQELVTRTGPTANCTSTGDRFCDTPADPNISGDVSSSCVYTGGGADANGDSYVPSTSNIMSYSRKECRTDFTPSQIAKMNYSVSPNGDPDRNSLTCASCSTIDLDALLPLNFPIVGFIVSSYLLDGEIFSNVNITESNSTGDNLVLVSTERVVLTPGFSFSSVNNPSMNFYAVVDECGGGGAALTDQGTDTDDNSFLANHHAFNTEFNKVYPNPTSGLAFMEVSVFKETVITIRVIDALGRQVMAEVRGLSKGENTVQLNTETLNQGLYLINISDVHGLNQTLKLQKID
ncbi:zinc-dependent metalloprotease [Cryomorphaceae bacterium 1068]|nr:zinc-dependent metalloprotease [Cryomorphaceae bacterium 1068]